MAHALTARVALVEGDRFAATTGSGGHAPLEPTNDAAPTGAISPMEALLVALGGCLGMSVAPILRKTRQQVSRYEIRVSGAVSERLPRVFESITVEHVITGETLDRVAIERAVSLAETRYCGVSAMLRATVEITHHLTLSAS
ncbi:MAG TPA: OsmC family protein [Ktedonobacterales bacterium]|nr:OsmC family protein [Ktedonobacterales bacterium]